MLTDLVTILPGSLEEEVSTLVPGIVHCLRYASVREREREGGKEKEREGEREGEGKRDRGRDGVRERERKRENIFNR